MSTLTIAQRRSGRSAVCPLCNFALFIPATSVAFLGGGMDSAGRLVESVGVGLPGLRELRERLLARLSLALELRLRRGSKRGF